MPITGHFQISRYPFNPDVLRGGDQRVMKKNRPDSFALEETVNSGQNVLNRHVRSMTRSAAFCILSPGCTLD